MQRRESIGAVTTAATALTGKGGEPKDKLSRPKETRRGHVPYRQFGNTKEEVSAISLGGHHIGRQSPLPLARPSGPRFALD